MMQQSKNSSGAVIMKNHMKCERLWITALVITLVLVFTGFNLPSRAQEQQRPRVAVRVTDVEIKTVKTPQYSTLEGTRLTDDDLKWLRINLDYEARVAEGEWIDNLRLDWYILILNGSTPRMLLKTSVSYLDINTEDDEHHAVVYVRPRTILRHYKDSGNVSERDVLVHVEVNSGGEMIAERNYSKTSARVPDRWWTFSAPRVTPLANALLARNETPFAPLDYDYYEYIQPESRYR